jgi:hypothetical protein
MKSYKEIYDALPEDEKKVLQSYTDSRVTEAIKKSKENVSIMPNAVNRLKAIEDATTLEINKLKNANLLMRKCHKLKLDFDSIEALNIPFNDEKDLDIKLNILAKQNEVIEKRNLNDFIASTAFKPSLGQTFEIDRHGLTPSQWDGLSIEEQAFIASGRK